MKKIITYCGILFTIILINGCTENVISPSEDDLITTKIIGKWKANNYETLVLNGDGTFIDTSLAIFSDNPNVYVPHYVVKGKYYVNNEILYFYDVRLLYAKADEMSPTTIAFGVRLEPRIIKINENGLTLQIVKILEPFEGNYPNLNGKWESTSWVGAYDKDIQPYFKGGEQKEEYHFYNDSLKFNYTSEYLFNTTLTNSNYITDYSFDGVNFQYDNLTYQVEFKNNKMYWFWYSINYSK